MNEQELADLSEIARQIRIMIIQMIGRSASGHPGAGKEMLSRP